MIGPASATRGVVRAGIAALLATAWTVGAVPATLAGLQAVSVDAAGGSLRVHAPGFTFIEGEVLNRLRDGRAVRLDFELIVFAEPGGAVIARLDRSFNLSFDLWEERFAATRIGTPPESVSHLTARAAETWCLEKLTLARTDLGRFSRDTPFWIRLGYRVADAVEPGDEASDVLTLRRLIDILSRRESANIGRTLDAGPFRLSQ